MLLSDTAPGASGETPPLPTAAGRCNSRKTAATNAEGSNEIRATAKWCRRERGTVRPSGSTVR